MADLDLDELRKFAREHGYYPGTTDPDHLARLRAQDARHERANRGDPQGTKWMKMGPSIGPR